MEGAERATLAGGRLPERDAAIERLAHRLLRRQQGEQTYLSEGAPALGLKAIAAHPERMDEIWEDLERISIDHAPAEPAAAEGKVAVVPSEFSWDDIGDFASLNDLLRKRVRRYGKVRVFLRKHGWVPDNEDPTRA